jgi:NADPH:quinone reductase-like Zn-dependent oxidoreductase
MRALQFAAFGPPEVLRIADLPAPHAGPGTIRIAVRASGLTPADWKLRAGLLGEVPLPHVTGFDAAGVIDEVGAGVAGARVGDEVFGLVDPRLLGGANADLAVLVQWELKPAAWSWEQAGGAAANVETATRALDRLPIGDGSTLLIEGAAGGVGTIAVQLARLRGATVIGTASAGNHALVASLGATPVTYGPRLADRMGGRAVDAVLDCAESGSLPELVALAGHPDRVVTIADLNAAAHGVHLTFSAGPGSDPMAAHGLAIAARAGITVPVAAAFPLAEAAAAHRLSATGHAAGKIVLTHA